LAVSEGFAIAILSIAALALWFVSMLRGLSGLKD
jgi:hypothetical protein